MRPTGMKDEHYGDQTSRVEAQGRAPVNTKPLVGVGILNHNGADLTLQCLDHLRRVQWPPDRLEVVVVDNGSSDNSLARIRDSYPEVRTVASPVNLGFAGGCNLAIRSLLHVDYLALLNNDAFVEPGWLSPLVEALESTPAAGAACSKVLFATSFIDFTIESDSFRLVGPEDRNIGVRISGLRIGTDERFERCHLLKGFWTSQNKGRACFAWTDGRAVLRVPISRSERGTSCSIRVSAESSKVLVIQTPDQREIFQVNDQPQWKDFTIRTEPFDLINNAGSELSEHKDAVDRGIRQPDRGQFDEPETVFAWCGCSVLLSPRYLRDVGPFDESLFLYYEDFDLSWRGQRRGWTYRYVPSSVVRHVHAATTDGEESDLFRFFVARNRLLVLVKNARATIAIREVTSFTVRIVPGLLHDLWNLHLSANTRQDLEVLRSLVAKAPRALVNRFRVRLGRNARKLDRASHR